MRIVVDTNVVVSSLWGGPPKKVMKACQAGKAKLILGPPILEEYFAVLSRFEVSDEDMDFFQALFADLNRVEIFSWTTHLRVIKEDPSDDKFLECALEGQANFIVSGDKHLLQLGSFRGISIISLRRFLSEI